MWRLPPLRDTVSLGVTSAHTERNLLRCACHGVKIAAIHLRAGAAAQRRGPRKSHGHRTAGARRPPRDLRPLRPGGRDGGVRGQESGPGRFTGASPRASLCPASPLRQAVWVGTRLRRQPRTCYYRDSRRREGGSGQGLWWRVNGIGKGPGVYSSLNLNPLHQEE